MFDELDVGKLFRKLECQAPFVSGNQKVRAKLVWPRRLESIQTTLQVPVLGSKLQVLGAYDTRYS